MELEKEIWKDIVGFESVYQISNHGRIKSFKVYKDGYVLSNTNKNGNYFSVVLQHNKKIRSTRIHVLVAEHFISTRPSKDYQVHHKDSNKQNNYVGNLEYISIKDHIKETIKQNASFLIPMINYNRFVRPNIIVQLDLNGNYIAEFYNAKEASINTKVCQRNILQVAHKTPYGKNNKIRKQAGGFIWELKTA